MPNDFRKSSLERKSRPLLLAQKRTAKIEQLTRKWIIPSKQ
nr:MAG TPA: hypothetical protein [Caudoviricetes sp.]